MYTSSTVPTDTQRMNFWASLIPGYLGKGKNAKKKAKMEYASRLGLKPYQITEEKMYYITNYQNSDPIVSWSVSSGLDSYDTVKKCSPNNGETDMNTDNFTTERRYLSDRLQTLYYEKDRDLEKTFGLSDDDPPKNLEEAVERIKAGKYTVPKDNDYYEPWYYAIRWRDPDLKEDRKGYDAASEKLSKAKAKAKDQIMVKTPDEGLAALEAFESQTFH